MTSIRSIHLLLSACLLLGLAGCSKFDLRKGIPWMPGGDGELERPMKIEAVWTDTVMSQAEETPVRGFGGRLMFYAREDAKPVEVKGSLVVYAFDETDRDPRNVRPERKYVFSEEEFAKHHSESKIGHSYSVWLPWDRIGGTQAEISLVVRFTPKEGGMIASAQQTVLLPGAAAADKAGPLANQPTAASAARPSTAIQQATYVEAPPQSALRDESAARRQATRGQSNEPERMTTTTIPISAGPGNRFPIATSAVAAAPAVGAPSARVNSPETAARGAQPAAPVVQSSAHFGPGRRRPLGAPIAPLDRDHGPWRPTHAGPPSAAGASRQSAPGP